jgi:hypothetical protein
MEGLGTAYIIRILSSLSASSIPVKYIILSILSSKFLYSSRKILNRVIKMGPSASPRGAFREILNS